MKEKKMADQKETPLRKSRIQKTITQKFTTGVRYEMLDITVSYDEVIEWKDLAERAQKSKNIHNLLLKDFEETRDDVFEQLKTRESVHAYKADNTD